MGYSNKTFFCPYFKWDEKLRVHCEGGKIAFPDRLAAMEYIDRHCGCEGGWQKCTLASALTRYYERTD